jgi:dTDP-glucose pyrophosphorylase
MAGGMGKRMHAGGGPTPKPLVPIRGVPLLERNILALLYAGFQDLVVAVPSHTPAVAEFAGTRGRALAEVFGARLELLEESQPLGNIGAAGQIEIEASELLVVYADNLTALPLNALVKHHRCAEAALTCAVHLESFRIPFGEVEVAGDLLVAYREKPERRVQVSSGLYVLAPAAIDSLNRGERTEVSWLVNRLLTAGQRVAVYPHDAPWIDVNDTDAIARAEILVDSHVQAFECRAAAPDATVVSVLVRQGGRLLLEHHDGGIGRYPGVWDLPGQVLAPNQPAEAALEKIGRHLGVVVMPGSPVCVFDDVDPASRRVYRHLVFAGDPVSVPQGSPPGLGSGWRDPRADPVSPVVTRSLAARRRVQEPA